MCCMGGIAFIAEPHPWIPAFAGMTELCKGLLGGRDKPPPLDYEHIPFEVLDQGVDCLARSRAVWMRVGSILGVKGPGRR